MKTMTVRETSRGKKTTLSAKRTYRNASGDWVAEVDKAEFRRACSLVCQGVKNCIWRNLNVQADLDDDGKDYKIVVM